MGALSPVITGLTTLSTAVGAANSLVGGVKNFGRTPVRDLRREQDLALRQLTQRQKAEERNLAEQTALERERLAADAVSAEDARRSALRRAVARQRASFGAQGIGSGDGSSQAVLLGLFDESDAERAQRERMDNIRSAALDLGASQQERSDVLQRSQLAERQKLARIVADG